MCKWLIVYILLVDCCTILIIMHGTNNMQLTGNVCCYVKSENTGRFGCRDLTYGMWALLHERVERNEKQRGHKKKINF
jgi:hypothetical protein